MAKTIKKIKEDEYFMSDTRLFLLWRLSRASFLPSKKDYFDLDGLFSTDSYNAKLGFEDIRINTELDKRFNIQFYSDSEILSSLPSDEEVLKKFRNKDYHKKILTATKNLRKNSFSSLEFTYLSSLLPYNAYSSLYFTPKENVDQNDPTLHQKLDNYIQSFIN